MSFNLYNKLATTLQSLLCSANVILSITPCLFSLLLITNTETAYAQEDLSKSYKIKAGFLLQLTSYVTWPSTNINNETSKNKKNNIEICIVGHDPFGKFIDKMIAIRPTTNKGKRINLRRVITGKSLNHCHVVFITERSIDDIFWQSLPLNHTYLLVSEYNGFLQKGGMISLKEDKKNIQLKINLQNSNDKKIIISPELLRISTIITTTTTTTTTTTLVPKE